MKTINISVRDKLPRVTSMSGRAVADNRYRLLFDFDEEWVEGLKTVVVAVSAKQYRMYPTTADYVDIELGGERYITVGVIQDTIATSQPCQILVNESIRKHMGEEIELPEPDVWTYITDQIRTLNSLRLYPVEKTAAMTQQVGVDAERRLWTYPGGSGGSGGIDRIFIMEGVSSYGPPTYTLNVLMTNGSVITCQLPNMGLELSDVITVSPSSPITSGARGVVGELWFDTTDRVLYVCISSSNAIGTPNWLAVGGESSSGGGTGGRGVLDVVFEAVNAETNGTSTYNMVVSLEDGTKITRRLPGFRNEDVVMFHNGAPSETLPAPRGKLLFDTDRQNMYVCADISGSGSGTRTIWKLISASGEITEETDPTVPSWAKQPEKPTYTASEVGALPDTTKIPEATSDLKNDSGYITIAVATLLNYYLKTETYAKTETYSQTEVDNLISGLDKRLNAIADSEDVDLDQLSEIVAYIKSNKSLIDSITTSKVSIADIIDNLTTADAKKPLSAAQGKALKEMYDALPAWAKAASKPTYTKSEVGLGNVDNVRQYSAQNPPPYPVTSVNGKIGAVSLSASDVGARPDTWTPTASDVGALPSGTKIPAKTSDITNDSGFITKAVTDLTNYYTKSQTYTQAEVNALVSAIPKFAISVVASLPISGISTTTIYLVKSGSGTDLYTEYIYTGGAWEILGSQRVDLTGYATQEWVNVQIADFLTADDLTAAMVTGALGYTPAKQTDVDALSKTIADYQTLTLGIASDGLCYVFIKGVPVGTGIPLGAVADIYGYIDENNHIVLEGVKNGGEYTYAFVLENGSTIHGGAFEYGDNTYYSVTSNLTNCTISNNAKTVVEGGSYAATISANSGYELKSVTVTMGGNTVSVSGGNINIASVTGNIVIVAVAEKVVIPTYAITNNLTNCTNSNSATSIQQGSAYSATITAKSGYELKSVSATMGGTAVSVSNGVVSIASVTGDIVITAVAEEIAVNYTNLFNPSSAVLNARLNSSKALTFDDKATGKVTTNFMDVVGHTPFSADTKIYIKGATFTSDGNTKLLSYKTASGEDYTQAYSTSNGNSVTVKDEGNGVISASNLASTMASGVRRMVMTLKVKDSAITAADIANIIITVNEPIG